VIHGGKCIGTFDLIFVREPAARRAIGFGWSVGAVANYQTHTLPDGATLDVHIEKA
jgi:hypothetical protein